MEAIEKLKKQNIDITGFSEDAIREIYSDYTRILKNYNCAIREVKTKLEVLDDDFELVHEHNPIHYMASRVKTFESIIEKAIRQDVELTSEAICKNIFDIAGIRVICHYIDDIYTIAELLKNQVDIKIIKEKDYIKNPKPNGYRSLHLVVTVPVFFVAGVEEIPVEVQIRTMAMDFWASLEHKLRYKSQGEIPKFIAEELSYCAKQITDSDLRMQKIHSFLNNLENNTIRE